jgi:hypothetical protein
MLSVPFGGNDFPKTLNTQQSCLRQAGNKTTLKDGVHYRRCSESLKSLEDSALIEALDIQRKN